MHFRVKKLHYFCNKLQKRCCEIFGIQLEVGEWGTAISEVLRPDAAWNYMQGRIACVRWWLPLKRLQSAVRGESDIITPPAMQVSPAPKHKKSTPRKGQLCSCELLSKFVFLQNLNNLILRGINSALVVNCFQNLYFCRI